MTTPTILPTGYAGDATDYLKTKVDRDGCIREQYSTVTIPATTVTTTVIGLVPFNKGFRLSSGATRLAVGDLDTSTNVTIDVGYVYKTGSAETDDQNAFASALTIAQTGGYIVFDEPTTDLPFVAADDGWIALTIGGGNTTTAGAFYGQISGCYDGLNAVN